MARRAKRKNVTLENDSRNNLKKSFGELNWRLVGKLLLSFTIILVPCAIDGRI